LLLIKRILFVLAIIIVISGHFLWNRFSVYREQSLAQKYANVTAHCWVAAAKYNDAPKDYQRYRDSLLAAENITKDEINEYLAKYQKAPEKYIHYASLVSHYVDSLAACEDSLFNVGRPLAADTAL